MKKDKKIWTVWKPNTEFQMFELDKPLIGKISVIDHPYKGLKNKLSGEKNPDYCLSFNGKPCYSKYQLQELAKAIKDGKVKDGITARITFLGDEKLSDKRKIAKYLIEI